MYVPHGSYSKQVCVPCVTFIDWFTNVNGLCSVYELNFCLRVTCTLGLVFILVVMYPSCRICVLGKYYNISDGMKEGAGLSMHPKVTLEQAMKA